MEKNKINIRVEEINASNLIFVEYEEEKETNINDLSLKDKIMFIAHTMKDHKGSLKQKLKKAWEELKKII